VLFGVYILLFFGGTAFAGAADRWNEVLPELHDPATPLPVLAIGAHFAAGGILLLLGPIQLMGAIRRAAPALHRWLGRLYVGAAGIAGLGGIGFILAKGDDRRRGDESRLRAVRPADGPLRVPRLSPCP
jgi:hypothetical protein